MSKTKPNIAVYTGGSAAVTLTERVGGGGEGEVYGVKGYHDLKISLPGLRTNALGSVVAKIYHKPATSAQKEKLSAMVGLAVPEVRSFTAWPLEMLEDPAGRVIGFTMPRIAGHKDIHQLYGPKSRRVEFPTVDFRFIVRAACNLAKALASLHAAGVVVGDVNFGGVAVAADATVKLLDCDSFQIQDGDKTLVCGMAMPLFTPPEVQGRPLQTLVRTPNHDNFGLAVLIFHLLMMGRHPFAGRYQGPEEMSPEKAIREFRYAYGPRAAALQMLPPPQVPAVEAIAGPAIAELFERAFNARGPQGGRPTGLDWVDALDALAAQLEQCPSNLTHWKMQGCACAWCDAEAGTGITLFGYVPSDAAKGLAPGMIRIDVDQIWSMIEAVEIPEERDDVLASMVLPELTVPRLLATMRWWGSSFSTMGWVFLVSYYLASSPGRLVVYSWAASLVLRGLKFRWEGRFEKLQTKCQKLAAELKEAIEAYNQQEGRQAFKNFKDSLQEKRDELKALPELLARRLVDLQTNKRHFQKMRYLDQFFVDGASIPSIGPSRSAMLGSYQIETAADLFRVDLLKVPGFGPATAKVLAQWVKELERDFRFDPSQPTNPSDIKAVEAPILKRRDELERALIDGVVSLERIKRVTALQREEMRKGILVVAAEYAATLKR